MRNNRARGRTSLSGALASSHVAAIVLPSSRAPRSRKLALTAAQQRALDDVPMIVVGRKVYRATRTEGSKIGSVVQPTMYGKQMSENWRNLLRARRKPDFVKIWQWMRKVGIRRKVRRNRSVKGIETITCSDYEGIVSPLAGYYCGMEIRPNQGGGDCLPVAFAQFLRSEQISPVHDDGPYDVREKVMNYMQEHREMFEGEWDHCWPARGNDIFGGDFPQYCQEASKPMVRLGLLEARAMAEVYDVTIMVHRPGERLLIYNKEPGVCRRWCRLMYDDMR